MEGWKISIEVSLVVPDLEGCGPFISPREGKSYAGFTHNPCHIESLDAAWSDWEDQKLT